MEAVKDAAELKNEKRGLSRVKRLDEKSAKLLAELTAKANKKEFGRKVRDTEIIAAALTLVKMDHLTHLQALTISGKDRLQMAYRDHCKKNGKSTYEDFINQLLGTPATS